MMHMFLPPRTVPERHPAAAANACIMLCLIPSCLQAQQRATLLLYKSKPFLLDLTALPVPSNYRAHRLTSVTR